MADISFEKTYSIDDSLNEDKIWQLDISPNMNELAPNVRRICQYGITEMLNNAIAHSASENIVIKFSMNDQEVTSVITDNGVGIFAKVQKDLKLDDPRHSILELVKGKFTSDPQNHSGEGIFFTSRIFDQFSIKSDGLLFFSGRKGDWHWEELTDGKISGTVIQMTIRRDSSLKISDVFNEYTDTEKSPGFHKTVIPLKLMECGNDSLISRSQAKRLISRFDCFLEVVIDFSGVEMIGQGFADELFRVFTGAHSGVNLLPVNCSQDVEKMIRHTGFTGNISK